MGAPKGNKYAVGNNGGRPKIVALDELPALGQQMLVWFADQATKGRLPFFSRFAREIVGCSEDTLIRCCEGESDLNKEFCVSYNECKAIQKEYVIENGLAGNVNSTFAIFAAKNLTDMKDSQQLEHKGNIHIKALNDEEFATILASYGSKNNTGTKDTSSEEDIQ